MCILNVCWIPVLDTFWMSARSTELDLEGWGPWKCDRGSLYKVQTGLENVGKMNCKFRVFSKARCMNPPTVWGLRWGNFGLTLDWVGFWFCTTLNFVEAQYHVGTTRFGLAPNTMLEFTGGSRNHCTRVRVHARTLKSVKAAKPPWNAQAAKPQSRHGTRKPQSRKAAMERASRKAAEPQALRLMRRLLRSSPLRCHRHGSLKPQSRKAASSEPSPVFIAAVLPERQEASKSRKVPRRRSTTKRQSGKASRSAKASRSVKASRSGTAPKRQRAANERLAVLRRGRACLRKEVCNQRLAVFRRGRACILRDNS